MGLGRTRRFLIQWVFLGFSWTGMCNVTLGRLKKVRGQGCVPFLPLPTVESSTACPLLLFSNTKGPACQIVQLVSPSDWVTFLKCKSFRHMIVIAQYLLNTLMWVLCFNFLACKGIWGPYRGSKVEVVAYVDRKEPEGFTLHLGPLGLCTVSMRAVHWKLWNDPPSPVHYGNQCQDRLLLLFRSLPRTAYSTAV